MHILVLSEKLGTKKYMQAFFMSDKVESIDKIVTNK